MDVFEFLPFAFNEFLLVVKLLLLLALLLYMVFAGILIRQVQLMRQSLSGILSLPILPVAYIHFVASVIVFLIAAVVL